MTPGVTYRRAGVVIVALLSSAIFAAQSPSDPLAVARTEFQRAYAQAAQSTAATEPADSAVLRGYVLYPYLQAARLAQLLRAASIERLYPERLAPVAANTDKRKPQPIRRNGIAVGCEINAGRWQNRGAEGRLQEGRWLRTKRPQP